MSDELRPELAALKERLDKTLDEVRVEAAEKRHAKGYRTARENLEDLVDAGSFVEYGQLAVAAQRSRRELEDLQQNTAADGVITGTATINGQPAAVVVYDYSVLAGTQGFFHHHKLDRIFEVAEKGHSCSFFVTRMAVLRTYETNIYIHITPTSYNI